MTDLLTMSDDDFNKARDQFAEAYSAPIRDELSVLRTKYEGCLAINREQVARLAKAEVELDMLRSKDDIRRKAIAELQAQITKLESPKTPPVKP